MNTYPTLVASHPALNVLVIGGDHTFGQGLPSGQGFVQRTLTDLEQAGYKLTTHYYAPITMSRLIDLQQHNAFIFHRYDLVLVQVGHIELVSQSLLHLLQTRSDVNTRLYDAVGARMSLSEEPADGQELIYESGDVINKSRFNQVERRFLAHVVAAVAHWPGLPYLRRVADQLRQVMRALNGCQDRVILVAPLPTTDPLTNALRRWGANRWQQEADRSGFTLINSGGSLEALGECWLDDGYHLNNRGHERLYQALRTEITRLLAVETQWGPLNEVPY